VCARGREIRNCDLHFIKRDSQSIELLLEDMCART
jgi:hypothetical protein